VACTNPVHYELTLLLDHVSGSEAMFADLCYFSVRSVQVMNHAYVLSIMASGWNSFTSFVTSTYILMKLMVVCLQITFLFLVLPCLLLGYLGQAAYLMEHHADAGEAFFSSVPSRCQCVCMLYNGSSLHFP
jgi:K+ transporter